MQLRCQSASLQPEMLQSQNLRGEVPSHLRVVPPGQRSGELQCWALVSVTLRVCVWLHVCSVLILCLLLYLWSCLGNLRTAKCWDTTFGVIDLCRVSCPLFAPPGAVPVVGGYLYPSVLRSPGVTPQECRAAHGPLHPAVTSAPRLCWFCSWFFVRVIWNCCWAFVWGFSSLGLECCLVCRPSGPDPIVRFGVGSPLFLFFCCWDVRRRRFSLFLSLSQVLGKPKPRLGFGFPLVTLHPGHDLPLGPVLHHRQLLLGHRPAPVFFFFVVVVRWSGGGSSRFVCGVLGWRVVSVLVGCCMHL